MKVREARRDRSWRYARRAQGTHLRAVHPDGRVDWRPLTRNDAQRARAGYTCRMHARADLHRLVDELPEAELAVAQRFLEFLRTQAGNAAKDAASDAAWEAWFAALPETDRQLIEAMAERDRRYGPDFESEAEDLARARTEAPR